AQSRTGCRAGLRGEPAGRRDPLSPRRAHGRVAVGLPLGRGAQGRVTQARAGGGMTKTRPVRRTVPREGTDVIRRVAAWDWRALSSGRAASGHAVIGSLLTPAQCAALADLSPEDAHFRRQVVMARHGYGRGEYKYFAYPLPAVVAALRVSLYPPLAQVANRWNEAMGIDVRFPDEHAAFIERCHEAGQVRPTPLLLQYVAGDFNCLHQDVYGEH